MAKVTKKHKETNITGGWYLIGCIIECCSICLPFFTILGLAAYQILMLLDALL